MNNKNYEVLCKNAREKILREFDYKGVVKKYIELYERIVGSFKFLMLNFELIRVKN